MERKKLSAVRSVFPLEKAKNDSRCFSASEVKCFHFEMGMLRNTFQALGCVQNIIKLILSYI